MDLSQVHQGVTKRKTKKRVGRGVGTGHGKTAGRGSKGQYASAGAKLFGALFEGGQTPLFRRLPKRGFSQNMWRKHYHVVNVGDIDRAFKDGDKVDPAALKAKGLANGQADGVREVLQACGIRNILSKTHGSTNPINLVKATIDGLLQLRTKQQVEALRGVKL